ncbi:alpha/beta hydrolase [Paenibacillus sp. alder61]|uniref:Alpha/beta hydrolase fold-5 domain-containing protein n=1 Tax=Paenibacillus faecis TaxID=862114 RepID=A0A5D0CM34_9BACL|nr:MULTISPECIES: alpha/beta hydrolase [Paenibacillus]MCA1295028.1 alpha/beta hydrolase [Paenibacillus sp. alder61]TYA10712.1 hypothetical protein FRY98_23265 [Paenibacillus faecis]
MTPKWKKGLKYAAIGLAAVLLAAGGGFWIYAQDYYRADAAARQVLAEPSGKVEALEKMWVFRPDPEQTGRERDGGSPGLILLGAYSAAAIPEDLPTLEIYGSEDRVLDRSKLPVSPNTLLEIAGGNHAYFGDYGEQKGDGTAAISREEQQRQTAEAIVKFMTDGHER